MSLDIAPTKDIARLLDWAAAEGWNPGLADATAFLAADPEGFLVGCLKGEVIAALSAVRYEAHFGFIGFYICQPAFRGKGYGWALWQAGMARLAGRTVGLDGVVAQQGNYAKSGFVLAHRNVRYSGRVMAVSSHPSVRPASEIAFDKLAAFDAVHFGARRDAFLRAWIAPTSGRIALATQHDSRLTGYGVLRPCRRGFKIGPLFAETPEAAERLFSGLAAEARGHDLFIDPPQNNGEALRLVERHGLAPVFETARMYRGPAPGLPLHQLYGVTTFELG